MARSEWAIFKSGFLLGLVAGLIFGFIVGSFLLLGLIRELK
ncbi:MAG TPA: hypothetical protein VN256_08225 [Pyrinomonadaceae bacterium]|nr:hypothetical protein [Pyrinomonadaceae bacterium]